VLSCHASTLLLDEYLACCKRMPSDWVRVNAAGSRLRACNVLLTDPINRSSQAISDYSVSQPTLEQVFLSFAAEQLQADDVPVDQPVPSS